LSPGADATYLRQIWRAFPNFYFDVGKPPSRRHLLIGDDPRGEFSPANARWRVARWCAYHVSGHRADHRREVVPGSPLQS
jgi:hypothetical protein